MICKDSDDWDENNEGNDKSYFYLGVRSAIDYDTFEVIYSGVVIDKNHVYRYGKVIDKMVEEARAESEVLFKRNNRDVGEMYNDV